MDVGLGIAAPLAALAGWFGFWTESEMWSAVVAKHTFDSLFYFDFSVKPLFNFVLFLNFQIARFLDVHPMDSARALFAANGLLMLWLFRGIARGLGASRAAAALFTLVLLSNSFVLKRFFSVRSDALITVLFLALTGLALSRYWKNLTPKSRGLIFLAFAGTGLCITPKSAIVALVWAIAFLRPARKPKIAFLAAGLAAVSAALAIVHALEPNALRFFLESFGAGASGMSYWHPGRWEHVARFLKENPLLVLAALAGLSVARSRTLSENERALLAFAHLNWLAMLPYPEKLPFYLASLAPFLMLALPAAWRALVDRHPTLAGPRIGIGLAALALASTAYWSAFLILKHSHREQKAYIAWLNARAEELRPLKIFDPVGIFPYAGAYHWFVGPAEDGNRHVVWMIRDTGIDLIIGTSKLSMLGQKFFDELSANFWTSGDGLYIRRHPIELKEQRISANQLSKRLTQAMPFLIENPAHKVHLLVQATERNLDLARFAKWSNGAEFRKDVSFEELLALSGETLIVPPGASLVALPAFLQTPFNDDWISLFRFDPEY